MSSFCAVCKVKAVLNDGDICPSCAAAVDPFAAAAGIGPNASVSTVEASVKPGKIREILPTSQESMVSKGAPRAILDGSTDGSIEADLNKLSPAVMAVISGASTTGASSMQLSADATSAVANAPGKSINASGTAALQGKANNRESKTSSSVYVKGVAKNVVQDTDRRGVVYRWFRALFKGSNFALDPDITEFQLYPDFSGQTLNSSGNLADQVIIYGKIKFGMVSENNDVEVYGRRDANGNIVAESVRNVATGAVAKPSMVISRTGVVVTTFVLLALMIAALIAWGPGFYLSLLCLVLFIVFLPYIIKFFVWLFTLILMKS